MDDSFLHVDGIGVGGGPRGLRTAPLVDGDVDEHRPPLHRPHHLAADELGRGGAGDEHRADDEIGIGDMTLDRVHRREDGVQHGAELKIEIVEALERFLDHIDPRFHAHRDAHRIGARDAAAEHDDLGRMDTGHTAEQDSRTPLLPFQIMGSHLDAHAPRHLAHGGEERQPSAAIADRFVRDRDASRAHERLGQPPVGGEMEIGKEHLTGAQKPVLARQRLLDLDHEIGASIDLLGRIDEFRPRAAIVLVVEAGTRTGTPLDEHPVAVVGELAHARGREPDPVFMRLDLPGNADEHGLPPPRGPAPDARPADAGSGKADARPASSACAGPPRARLKACGLRVCSLPGWGVAKW